MKNGVPRILVVRLSALGDVLHVLPALGALRRAMPQAELSWLVEDRVASLFGAVSEVDRLLVFPRSRWNGDLRRPWRWRNLLGEFLRYLASIRQVRYDMVLDFQGNLKSGIHCALLRAQKRIGFARETSKEWNHLFQDVTVAVRPLGAKGTPQNGAAIHRVDRNLGLLAGLPIDRESAFAPSTRPDQDRDSLRATADRPVPPKLDFSSASGKVSSFLQQTYSGNRPLVLLHPGTSAFGTIKRWDVRRFAQLGDRLSVELGARVLVTWGPGEKELAAEMAGAMREAASLSCPTESLAEYGTLLMRADLFIGSDSGPLHLANFLDVPVVGLYGPKDPAIYGPYFGDAAVVWKRIPCSPCNLRRCPFGKPICMDLIQVGDVLDAARRLWTKVLERRAARQSASQPRDSSRATP